MDAIPGSIPGWLPGGERTFAVEESAAVFGSEQPRYVGGRAR
jgi:hypothetical protein